MNISLQHASGFPILISMVMVYCILPGAHHQLERVYGELRLVVTKSSNYRIQLHQKFLTADLRANTHPLALTRTHSRSHAPTHAYPSVNSTYPRWLVFFFMFLVFRTLMFVFWAAVFLVFLVFLLLFSFGFLFLGFLRLFGWTFLLEAIQIKITSVLSRVTWRFSFSFKRTAYDASRWRPDNFFWSSKPLLKSKCQQLRRLFYVLTIL